MKGENKQYLFTEKNVSFWKFLSFVFVIFSLYLLRDVFFIWDGFRFHSTFLEFIPSVALISIFWSILAILTALLIWGLLKAFEWCCRRIEYEIRVEHVLLYTGIFAIFVALTWKGKRLLFADIGTSLAVKSVIFICVALISAFVAWLLRDRANRWINQIIERIIPLVWLFGSIVFISVPIVTYYALVKKTDKIILQKVDQVTASDKKKPNIILVTFDALTARDMSLYGYHLDTTPFISEWSRDATVFTKAEAASNFTNAATASLMTGKNVWTHQVYHQSGSRPVNSKKETLPYVLMQKGYYNAAFIVNPFASVSTLGISSSFKISPIATEFMSPEDIITGTPQHFGYIDALLYRMFGDKIRLHDWIIKRDFALGRLLQNTGLSTAKLTKTASPPETAFNRLLEVYEKLPQPFFIWIHVFPPHAPYLPPQSYKGMFKSLTKMPMHDSYDEFIRYCDKEFEKFTTRLKKKDNLENTAIILSADHGESFQHNVFAHKTPHLYEQLTHIPLVIKEPGQKTNIRIVSNTVQQIDIPATILDLANISIPAWMEGRSLLPLMHRNDIIDNPIFSMNLETNPSRGNKITKGTIAVWEGDYKLIHYLEDKKSLLFNLKQDPDEMKDLTETETEIHQHLLNILNQNLNDANERIKKKGTGS